MKRALLIILMVVILSIDVLPVKKVILKKESDYLDKLLDNDVYFKKIEDVDNDGRYVYFLDEERAQVFQVEFESAKLVRTFFRRGQGPSELMTPASLRVRNHKIFVLDSGFNGIKIIGLDGKLVNEFKTKGMSGDRNFDVNEKNEIFLGEYHSLNGTYVSVYNLKGELLRSMCRVDKKKGKLPLERIHYFVRLDDKGNIVLLFSVTRELIKFNDRGDVLWKTKVFNDIIAPYKDGFVKYGENNTVHTLQGIFGLTILKQNRILIGHVSGGCIYDENGKLTHALYPEIKQNIGHFTLIDSKLINVLVFGNIIDLIQFKEDML